ncbi:hypothetical protein N0V82_004733 [Gnomoniopsis sp. IMI 355080]|nr:hypothetical protein N0V82_004733 [Gnomoniopsis sp. IMI 355080]
MANKHIPADQRDFQSHKQALTDYFSEWRRGRWPSYNPNERRAQIANTQHPKPGSFKGLVDPFLSNPHLRFRRTHRRVVQRPRPEDLNGQQLETYNRAQRAASALSDRFRPARFTYEGIVGYGGFGVAVRFSMTDGRGVRRSIVVKTDLQRSESSVKGEREYTILMAGAEHVVQRILVSAMPIDDKRTRLRRIFSSILRRVILSVEKMVTAVTNIIAHDPTPRGGTASLARSRAAGRVPGHDPDPFPPRSRLESWWTADSSTLEARRLLDRRQNILILEWCKHGDLGQWINKMAELRDTEGFSEKIMWLILECLWKGSVALAYPRAFSPWPLNPRIQQAPLKSESIKETPPDDPVVHFDLDASNGAYRIHIILPCVSVADPTTTTVFVGDFGDHYDVPIAKVGLCIHRSVMPRINKRANATADRRFRSSYAAAGG